MSFWDHFTPYSSFKQIKDYSFLLRFTCNTTSVKERPKHIFDSHSRTSLGPWKMVNNRSFTLFFDRPTRNIMTTVVRLFYGTCVLISACAMPVMRKSLRWICVYRNAHHLACIHHYWQHSANKWLCADPFNQHLRCEDIIENKYDTAVELKWMSWHNILCIWKPRYKNMRLQLIPWSIFAAAGLHWSVKTAWSNASFILTNYSALADSCRKSSTWQDILICSGEPCFENRLNHSTSQHKALLHSSCRMSSICPPSHDIYHVQ